MKTIMTPIHASSMTPERIHEIGAMRHREHWLSNNLRVVDTANRYGLNLQQAEVKALLAEIVLRLLDGSHVERGEDFDKEKGIWVKAETDK